MKHQRYNNKRVIWESKTKQIILIAVSFLLTAAALWTKEKYSSMIFWGTIALFGGGGLLMLVQLLNPNNLFVTHRSALGKEIMAKEFEARLEDHEFFTYNDTGFCITDHAGPTHYNWTAIETVFGYKEDRFTTDEICLDIFMADNQCIKLMESTADWYTFNEELIRNIPLIPHNWEYEIAVPAFDTKLTLLFDKKGRTAEQAEAACYNV